MTVLEAHRRIYRLLFELEDPRWTPRELDRLTDRLLNEIELLWLTGELRLERPKVDHEVDWGLHFFRESLFGGACETYNNLRSALQRHYGEHQPSLRPFLRFSSWIGGDRDGNPSVTSAVTGKTLASNRSAAVRRLIAQVRASMLELRRKETCDGNAIEERVSGEVIRYHWRGCEAPVEWYLVEGGGHTWPGARSLQGYGHTTREISASKLIFCVREVCTSGSKTSGAYWA